MEKKHVPTFEEVNAIVEQNSASLHAHSASVKISPDQLKGIWVVARPILVLVGSLGILPAKWRTCINNLIEVVDVIATK